MNARSGNSRSGPCRSLALCVIGVLALSSPLLLAGAYAQTAPWPPAAPKASKPPPKAPPKADADSSAPKAGDGALRQRVEQLEEQLVDLQVVIGTLESLARGGTAAPAPSAAGRPGGLTPGEAGRLDGLETQIRALAAQVERLAEQIRALEGRVGPQAATAPPPRFGSTTVIPGPPAPASRGDDGDPIAKVIKGAPPPPAAAPTAPAAAPAAAPTAAAPAPPAALAVVNNPRQLYEVAYGFLLQQDYAAAEGSFLEFLRRYPSEQLAGNAQYWLGESYFVRGMYQQAARAFLTGYQTYRTSQKAPDSLLKLAMSLDHLGQRSDACATYAELAQRFPQAPAHVRNRAQTERTRLACT